MNNSDNLGASVLAKGVVRRLKPAELIGERVIVHVYQPFPAVDDPPGYAALTRSKAGRIVNVQSPEKMGADPIVYMEADDGDRYAFRYGLAVGLNHGLIQILSDESSRKGRFGPARIERILDGAGLHGDAPPNIIEGVVHTFADLDDDRGTTWIDQSVILRAAIAFTSGYNSARRKPADNASSIAEVFHRLWGQSRSGQYVKADWILLQNLLFQARAMVPPEGLIPGLPEAKREADMSPLEIVIEVLREALKIEDEDELRQALVASADLTRFMSLHRLYETMQSGLQHAKFLRAHFSGILIGLQIAAEEDD